MKVLNATPLGQFLRLFRLKAELHTIGRLVDSGPPITLLF